MLGNGTRISVSAATKITEEMATKDTKKHKEKPAYLDEVAACVWSEGNGGGGSPGRDSCTALMSPPSA